MKNIHEVDPTQVALECLQEENTALRADVARLTEAIDYVLRQPNHTKAVELKDELRTRTFPPAEPEYDEVEVKAWMVIDKCGNTFVRNSERGVPAVGEDARLIELKGIDRIPRKKKVLKREEITVEQVYARERNGVSFAGKLYHEWEG